jgi:hypothetical protein
MYYVQGFYKQPAYFKIIGKCKDWTKLAINSTELILKIPPRPPYAYTDPSFSGKGAGKDQTGSYYQLSLRH